VQTNANLGMTQTSGYDLKLSWSRETEAGLLNLDYRGTWVREYEFERVPGDPAFSRAGRYFDGFPVPRYTHYLFFDWQKDDWSAQVQNQFVRGYVDCNAECGVPRGFFNEVGGYSHWNLAVTHDLSPSVSVTAHVFNLFDTDPPFSNGGLLCTGCDTRFANPTGRAFGLTVQGRLD
jgi:iron complex outermembrane receptor protein